MASTRLTNNHREVLLELVRAIVDCPAEIKAEASAYAKAMPLARKIVESKYAPDDMKVLAKYKCSQLDECIRVSHPDGSVQQFMFKQSDAPLVPDISSCYNRMYQSDDRQAKAIEAWVEANEALRGATKKKHAEYTAFIQSSTTFEQVLEIWPEAAQVADRIRVNLPAAVSPDMLARIKADSAARMKRAA